MTTLPCVHPDMYQADMIKLDSSPKLAVSQVDDAEECVASV
ncbi:unnamed protein product [Rhodiola kirilowii]